MIGRAQGTTLRDAARHLIAASLRPDRAGYIAKVKDATPATEQHLLDDETLEKLWQLYRGGLIPLPAAPSSPEPEPSLSERLSSYSEGTDGSAPTEARIVELQNKLIRSTSEQGVWPVTDDPSDG